MTAQLLTEQHLEFLRLKGGCTCSYESTLVKMPHCWKSHVGGIFYYYFSVNGGVIDISAKSMTILLQKPTTFVLKTRGASRHNCRKRLQSAKGRYLKSYLVRTHLFLILVISPILHAVCFSSFCCRLLIFFKIDFYAKYFRNTIRVSSCLEKDQNRRKSNILRGGCRISGKTHPGSFVLMVVGFALVIVSHFF